MKHSAPPQEPWYHDGLAFRCTRCGQCCTGAPGFVWVNDEEVEAIAGVSSARSPTLGVAGPFYTRKLDRGRSLRERANGDCIFYQAGTGCTIYSVRPRQCRTWPFWEKNVASPDALGRNVPRYAPALAPAT